ncbi:histidine kinase [Saccharopolyspora sp. NPDC002376]
MHRFVRWIRRSGAVLPTPLRPPDRATARQRYRLERMLHDGAVAEISALALELGMIYDTARDEAVAAQVATAQRRVNGILDDLRSVESWIYPPVLASAGLGPGLRAVAERCELRLSLDLPQAELGSQTRARVGLLIADHFHNLPPGSVVRVRVKGRRVIRVSITDQQPGGEARRAHRAVLRCA